MVERIPTKINIASGKVGDNQNEQSLLQQIMQTFDRLSDGRLVEKISRPINAKARLELVEAFLKQLQELHQRLERIRTELADTNQANNKDTTVKGRSVQVGTTSSRFGEWKKSIKAIECRYFEVLIEGSFKHYGRVSKLLGINRSIDVIDIELWAHECLRNKQRGTCCN